jgi:hypothetical protein
MQTDFLIGEAAPADPVTRMKRPAKPTRGHAPRNYDVDDGRSTLFAQDQHRRPRRLGHFIFGAKPAGRGPRQRSSQAGRLDVKPDIRDTSALFFSPIAARGAQVVGRAEW